MKKNYQKYFLPNISMARKRLQKSLTKRHVFNFPKSYRILGQNRSFFIKTYGCQSNIYDSENIKGILISLGFKPASSITNADLIILNTCAIRENAEKKVFGEVGFLKKMKTTNPQLLFGICGCMPQEEKTIDKIVKINHVDFVFGTHNIYMLPEILDQVINHHQKVIQVFSKEGDVIEGLPISRNSQIKAFVNVMYGCDKFCTYCIVPYTRGRMRSRSKEDIISEINNLITQGYKEVTLIGQNVNSYGIDLSKKYRFWDLLKDVANTKIPRVRFVTSNPWNFDKKIVDVMRQHLNIMPYIHLPIQSGDENILRKMNRTMKIKDYYDKINYIRKRIPTCAISTDIIVGFPNETAKQFANTIKMYKHIEFDNAYTFIYSLRIGTPAALLKDKVSLSTKEKRLAILNELVRQCAKANSEKWIGKEVMVLVEGPSKTNVNVLTGYSPEWKVVNFKGTAKVGDIVKVKITSASRFSLNGEIV